MQIILAPSADLAKTLNPHITVEAEYGSVVAEGSLYTSAHHQPGMEDRPAPCNDKEIPLCPPDGIILVSHLDLDTVGGCLRAMGWSEVFGSKYDSFWSLAQFVDLNGPHKLGLSGASQADLDRLYAYWAWHKVHTPRYPRDQVSDVSEVVGLAGKALIGLLDGQESLLEAGREFKAAEDALNQDTFKSLEGRIIVREAEKASQFCNHLYTTPDGEVGTIVVCLNLEFGSVTVSFADPIPGLSCREVVQELWGPEAGGHDGIAGSPRERQMSQQDVDALVERLTR